MKKNIVYFIMASLVAVGFTSCEDFLTTDSPSLFQDDYIFNNEEDANNFLMSVYNGFCYDPYRSRLSNVFHGNTDVEAGGASDDVTGHRSDVWSLRARGSASWSDFKSCWEQLYESINRANECIEGLLASDRIQEDAFQQMLGEAYTLRAYWYYLLINFWADVPLLTKATKAGDEFFLPRTDRDTTLTFLINDLIGIEENMQWADGIQGGIERIGREFTMGMISRLALMRAGYSMREDGTMRRAEDYMDYYKIARDYSEKLISLKDRELNPDFGKIFHNQCEYIVTSNEDVLFEVAFKPGNGDVAWNHGVRVDNPNDAGIHPYGSGSNYLSLPVTYFYSFDPADKRIEATFCFHKYDGWTATGGNEIPQAATAIAPGKWNRLWMTTPLGATSSKGTGINWPLMRYSDVLLMFAEAENELNGPTGAAQNALKRVRKRAFDAADWSEKVDAYVATVSGGKQRFFEAIVDERAWEFGGECLRKFDLIRWNLYGKKITETRNTLAQMGYDVRTSTGKYANYPDYIYYTRNADGSVNYLDMYNKIVDYDGFVKVEESSGNSEEKNESGIYRKGWLRDLISTTNDNHEPSDYVKRNWRGYFDVASSSPESDITIVVDEAVAVPYVLPIPQTTVTTSMGILDNKGYSLDWPLK